MNNIFIKISFIRKNKLLMQMCIFYIKVSWLISQQWYWFKPRKLSRLHKACFTSRQMSLKLIIICSSASSFNEGFVRLIQTWFKVTHAFLNVCESFESFVHVFNSLKSIIIRVIWLWIRQLGNTWFLSIISRYSLFLSLHIIFELQTHIGNSG